MRKLIFGVLMVALGAFSSAQLPAGFTDTAYVSGLTQPIGAAFAPDGRMFVIQKGGAIKVVQGGKVVSTFTNLSVTTNSERGLLGIALDPDFTNTPYVYVYYTTGPTAKDAPSTPKNRVSRLTANGNVALAESEVILLDDIPSDAGNHNAGCLQFASDGYLYVSTGDGGIDHTSPQNLGSLAGKILRFRKDGVIPTSNPFYGSLSARNEIFMYGFRNPFRFSVRPGTSTLFIGDVGESTWEEVNVGVKGGNFGWNTYEGPTNVEGFVSPAFAYQHTDTLSGCITGGVFMVGKRFAPPYDGSYFYADYIRDDMRRIVFDANNNVVSESEFEPATDVVDILEGPDGALYYASISGGTIRRIVYKTTLNAITLNPSSLSKGQTSKATVTLDNPAPAAGALINLSATGGASVPSSIRIVGGSRTGIFNVGTTTATSDTVTVTASRLGVTKSATLTTFLGNDATFVSQVVPSSMLTSHQYSVSVTMHNSGSTTWTHAAGYRLLSYNPSSNKTWGIDRMYLPSNVSVPPGGNYTFTGTVTAPATAGIYNMQWRMVQNGTFGQPSTNVVVTVN